MRMASASFVVLFFENQLADRRIEGHDLDGRHAADARLDRRQQLLGDDALHVEGDRAAQGRVHLLRERGREYGRSSSARSEAWIVPNTRWPVSAAWMAVMNVSRSRISPTSITSGSSRTACFMPISKSFTSRPISRWLIRHLSSREDELDRIFERQDVLAVAAVDPVEHRGDGRALARTGDAGQQDHALVELAESFDDRRQVEALEVGNPVVHPAGDQADVPELLQHVHAESPAACRRRRRCRRSRPRRRVEDLVRPLVHHGKTEADHLFVVDRRAVQRPQACRGRGRRAACHTSGAGRSPPA